MVCLKAIERLKTNVKAVRIASDILFSQKCFKQREETNSNTNALHGGGAESKKTLMATSDAQ